MAKIPEKPTTDTHGGTFFTSGGNIPPSNVPDNLFLEHSESPESPKSPFQPTPCTALVIDPSPTVSSFESNPSFSQNCGKNKTAINKVQVLF